MTSISVNQYGDTKIVAGAGHGIDVASQRADDLDQACLDFLTGRKQALPSETRIYAADLGCGQCGQGLRIARQGVDVTCIDVVDQFEAAKKAADADDLHMHFHVADMVTADTIVKHRVHAVISQRAIHYLDYTEARATVRTMANITIPGGKIYLSASGIQSELGQNYPGAAVPLEQRKAKLDIAMAQKHNILEPVCLYSEDDMRRLLSDIGLTIDIIYSSAFGNIKAIASVPE